MISASFSGEEPKALAVDLIGFLGWFLNWYELTCYTPKEAIVATIAIIK